MTALIEQPQGLQSGSAANPKNTTWLQVLTDIHPRYGGVSSAVPELSRALQPLGIHAPIAALCNAHEQSVPWQLSPESVHFFPRSHKVWALRQDPHARLESVLRECDGLHVHGLWTAATYAAQRAARRTSRPFCLAAHGMLEPWSLQQHRLRKQIYGALIEHRVMRNAACLHALTRSEAESYRAITREVPVAVVPNGVDVPNDIAEEHLFAVYPNLRGRRILLFLSRLHPKKAVDVLLKAWPSVHASFPDAHLVIAGTGQAQYEAALKAWAAERCPHESVTFTGLLQGRIKWAALKAAECFVLPSHSEGFSVAILEALGSGTPVIATRECNPPELESAACGWLTEPNERAVRDALHNVLQNGAIANGQAGERGRALVQQRYTWSVAAQHMSELYRWLDGGAMPSGIEVLR